MNRARRGWRGADTHGGLAGKQLYRPLMPAQAGIQDSGELLKNGTILDASLHWYDRALFERTALKCDDRARRAALPQGVTIGHRRAYMVA